MGKGQKFRLFKQNIEYISSILLIYHFLGMFTKNVIDEFKHGVMLRFVGVVYFICMLRRLTAVEQAVSIFPNLNSHLVSFRSIITC